MTPIRFPGGSIGELAVNGTVNDLAVSGARPLALTLSLVLEEGLRASELRTEIDAIARAADAAGVHVITGDTKVVERGHADQMYACTTGIGTIDPRAQLSPSGLAPGDRILVSGRIGEHGMAVMLARDEFSLEADIRSDTRSLWPAVDALLGAAGPDLHCMRDATRGGVASALNELARASGVAALVREADVPVAAAVAGAAELLGIDPMYVANEGKLLAFVAPDCAEAALAALRTVAGCEQAAEIGEIAARAAGHGARGHRVRRAARDGPARRRPAAANLLMHELSISRAILDTAHRHAAGRRVVRVSVTIGALRAGRARNASLLLRDPRARDGLRGCTAAAAAGAGADALRLR